MYTSACAPGLYEGNTLVCTLAQSEHQDEDTWLPCVLRSTVFTVHSAPRLPVLAPPLHIP